MGSTLLGPKGGFSNHCLSLRGYSTTLKQLVNLKIKEVPDGFVVH